MDNMFEAVQATHFKKSKFTSNSLGQFYTKEWECRVFKRIGNYLRAHGMTINQAFDQIDEDGSGNYLTTRTEKRSCQDEARDE